MNHRPEPAAAPPPGCPAHNRGGMPLYGPEFAADPTEFYERLRRQGAAAPVELAPGVDAMLVTGYRAALEVLRTTDKYGKDPRRWRALVEGRIPADSPVLPMMHPRPNCLLTEGAVHARYRAAVTGAFDRLDMHLVRGYVESAADMLIDRFAPRGEADLLAEYATLLPLYVFNELFGCPPEYGDRLVVAMAGIFDGVDAERANAELTACMADLLAMKRREPGADITSWLLEHPVRLTDEEMIHQLILLMGAGTEPEQNLIANTLRLLLTDERFAGDVGEGRLLIEDAFNEVLWTDPPMANYAVHFPYEDTFLEGVPLYAGEPVMISFTAANNDPALAASRREGNRAHLAWSAGPHHCPAKEPARVIASVAVERVLDRLPDLELAVPPEELAWRPGPFHRALATMPVVFPPVAAPAAARSAAAPAYAQYDATRGESRWNPAPAPSSSTPSAATSTGRERTSASRGLRLWSNSLARWWHGR
ncbi:cytochrome P450 [Streptomyces thermolineatus]|uniref:Cytochrome P450 n=2 Tax=Streptomyces TaxID=1883 RepID=A0ABP5Y637_9ACTN